MTIREKTEALLRETNFITHLNTYGNAQPVGSFLSDLMAYNDLDLYMDSTNLTAAGYHTLTANLIRLYSPIRFDGFFDPEHNTAFIGLEILYQGDRWNIDIWWKTPTEIRNATEDAQSMLTLTQARPELRRAILDIKGGLCERRLYGLDKGKKHYHSKDIYNAVLIENILTLDDFIHIHPV